MRTLTDTACPTCQTIFKNVPVSQDEDGRYAALDMIECAEETCEEWLCRNCEQFHCDGCGERFCLSHQVLIADGTPKPLKCCATCAADALVEQDREPECTCTQTDVDFFDTRTCEFHNPRSEWNAQRRAVTSVQRYESQTPEVA